VIGELLHLRSVLYGEVSESVLQPKLQLAVLQRQAGEHDSAMETLQSGSETCQLLLEDQTLTKDQRVSVTKMYGEFL
jgi:hypothetical protein